MKRSIHVGILFLAFALLSGIKAYAQNYHMQNIWQHVMPGTFIYKTFEDSRGYLWFLTDKGISRYDGTHTRAFDERDGYDETGAYHVVEDSSGHLYFVTINFSLFEFSNGAFTRIPTPGAVAWVDVDAAGRVYLFFREARFVSRLFPDHHSEEVISLPLKGSIYMGMHLARDRFIISTQQGLWLAGSQTTSRLLEGDTYKSSIVPRMFRTKGRVLLTGEHGIYALNKQMKADLLYPLKRNEVFSICEDEQTTDLWVGSSRGLQVFKNGIYPGAQPVRVSYGTDLLSIMRSGNNSFWVSSANKGIYVTNTQTKHITAGNGLKNDKILFIGKESGRIYYFSNDQVFYEQQPEGIRQRLLTAEKDGAYASRSIMWIQGVSDTALLIFGMKNYQMTRGMLKAEEVPRDVWTNLRCESYGRLLFGYADGRVAIDRPDNFLITAPRWAQLRAEAQAGDKHIRTERMFCIDGDSIYYAGENTLVKVYWKGDQPVFHYQEVRGKISHVIRHGDAIHVSTLTHGFYLLRGDSVQHISQAEGLLSDYCVKSFFHKNRIWLATRSGLSRIDATSPLVLTNFTRPDYLIDNEVNDLLFMNDTVYVATSSGVSIFPENISYIRKTPRVFIERFQINNRDTQVRDHYQLPYTANNFTFHFSSPDYRSANNNLFRFVIMQDKKADTSYYTSGIIQLSSLMPDDYTFSISVKNIDGIWSDPVRFSVSIAPPFWRTWWFMLLSVLVLMAGTAAAVFFVISRHRQKHEYQMKMVESEMRSLRLYMNPHFIFNSLSSLQSFILTNQNRDAELFITKFSKLIRSVMSFSQKGELTLEEETRLLTNYLELEKIRFRDRFDFKISVDPRIDVSAVTIPSLLIQPFAENAIRHGFSEMNGRKGFLEITFSMQDNDLYCTVTDNGKGRQLSQASGIHISSGIRFTEERLRLILQKPNQEVIRFSDLEADGRPAGLKVFIYVPIINKKD